MLTDLRLSLNYYGFVWDNLSWSLLTLMLIMSFCIYHYSKANHGYSNSFGGILRRNWEDLCGTNLKYASIAFVAVTILLIPIQWFVATEGAKREISNNIEFCPRFELISPPRSQANCDTYLKIAKKYGIEKPEDKEGFNPYADF